jgi:1,4-dihydroxy-2-naphthoate octaprenyltransferase
MPFFCFALAEVPQVNWISAALAFVAIHLFYNPASNGFNSYYDKDEKSIGGLEHPPQVEQDLLRASLLFDAIALVLAAFVNGTFAIMLLIIGFVSKAYSHPSIRLKKYPVLGLLTVSLFQGAWTYGMSYVACCNGNWEVLFDSRVVQAATLSSVLLLGSYPMTQIYQHEEDLKRGDKTFSAMLGVRGTFLWTAAVFGLAALGMSLYFASYYDFRPVLVLFLCLTPTLLFFMRWAIESWESAAQADFKRTMLLNLLSSVSFILFFVFLFGFHHYYWTKL